MVPSSVLVATSHILKHTTPNSEDTSLFLELWIHSDPHQNSVEIEQNNYLIWLATSTVSDIQEEGQVELESRANMQRPGKNKGIVVLSVL